MRVPFLLLLSLCSLASLPLCQPTIILGSATAASATTAGVALGAATASAAAGAIGVVAVAGALIVSGVIAAAAVANRRGKRDTAGAGAEPTCLPMNNPDLFIALAASSDTIGCGMRLVCELEATPDELLSREEHLILGLFGRQIKPAPFSELMSPKAGFQYAAFVGANAKNVSECASVFDLCPYDRRAMMELFNASK
ncbi:uncharacterized protein LOC135211519 [Macrobrachium nipponense]|uniref:uncharacterized protein LOC135211519 n=1 Tax=Macrobrachium nipponense TaxID=159736 RepID=UPI0030C878D7